MILPIADLPLFVLASTALVWLSRKSLWYPRSHGFWRGLAGEAIIALAVLNRREEGAQWLSESLLQLSLVLLVLGLFEILRRGRASAQREDAALFGWERTTVLVTRGIYRRIRHPLYASLLVLAWGLCLRAVSPPGVALAVLASYLLLRAARAEEAESLAYFGEPYRDYMRCSRRFIPWLW